MLRNYLIPFRQAAASTSQASALHTSAVCNAAESFSKRQARAAKKANVAAREARQRATMANRPHVVLGTRPSDPAKWETCDLAKVVLTDAQVRSAAAPVAVLPLGDPAHKVAVPPLLAHGVGETESRMLMQSLPILTAEARGGEDPEENGHNIEDVLREETRYEAHKANAFARLVDLRNANARGIQFESRRRVVAAFTEPDRPWDTGKPEVQIALCTAKIRHLWTHLIQNKRDIANRRSLRKLVHQRAKMLKYLKRVDRDRYEVILQRVGLEPGAVEGELVV